MKIKRLAVPPIAGMNLLVLGTAMLYAAPKGSDTSSASRPVLVADVADPNQGGESTDAVVLAEIASPTEPEPEGAAAASGGTEPPADPVTNSTSGVDEPSPMHGVGGNSSTCSAPGGPPGEFATRQGADFPTPVPLVSGRVWTQGGTHLSIGHAVYWDYCLRLQTAKIGIPFLNWTIGAQYGEYVSIRQHSPVYYCPGSPTGTQFIKTTDKDSSVRFPFIPPGTPFMLVPDHNNCPTT